MAKVIKVGRLWCVAHQITGQVLVRQGRVACYETEAQAQTDARATRRRVRRKQKQE